MKNQNAITAVDGRFLADEDLGKVYGATKLESTHCVLLRTTYSKEILFLHSKKRETTPAYLRRMVAKQHRA